MSNQLMTFDNFNALISRQKSQIEKALPKHMDADRLLRIILTEARKTPKLLECSTASLMGCVMLSAQLGLEPGPLGHCYYVPYKNDSTFIIGYKGMLDLAYRSDKVAFVDAHCVFANDFFEFEYGSNAMLRHKPTAGDRGAFLGAYSTVTLKDGGKHFRYLPKSEIDKSRATSKSGGSQFSPWVNHYEEMACKTAVRKLFKYLPVSIEIQKSIAHDEASDYGRNLYTEEAGLIIEGETNTTAKVDVIETIMSSATGEQKQ